MSKKGASEERNLMRENVQLAWKVYLRSVLALILSFFLYLSISFMVSAFGTSSIGYQVMELGEDGQYHVVSVHYFSDDTTAASGEGTTAADTGTTAESGTETPLLQKLPDPPKKPAEHRRIPPMGERPVHPPLPLRLPSICAANCRPASSCSAMCSVPSLWC